MDDPIFGFLKNALPLSPSELKDASILFHEYKLLISQCNKKTNLISENDIPKIWTRHFLDSVMAAPFLKMPKKAIDIGSGAGMPGIPLKIIYQGLSLTLLESNKKKCEFLEHAKTHLKLSDTRIICDRAETVAKNTMEREMYDFGVTRAFAKPAAALEMVLPFVKMGGMAIFWGSVGDWSDEEFINRIAKMLGGGYSSHLDYTLPGDQVENARRLTIIEKFTSTGQLYPRSVGIPTKRPLK